MAAAGLRNLAAVQIDAHADLRNEYEGSRFSHACAARRISEVCPVFGLGIRNLCEEEIKYLGRGGRAIVRGAEGRDLRADLRALARFVRGKQVYLTIDLDGLDPSIMPAVGTPEPGGLYWEEVLAIVRAVCRAAAGVPVFDVVELAPVPGLRSPDFLAAKLVYKILSLWLLKNPGRRGEG
jgi:agmatinase